MKFIKKYFWAILLLLTFISYGQIIKMGSWQDDNAIFFKLEHINEPAGFFGRGLIGEGPYRFSFTPYWFIYKIFGNSNFVPYYLLILIFYFLSGFTIYKFFSKFTSKNSGVVAGILFTCGFIASDGFMWLANAMVANISIILLYLCLTSYYNFCQKRKILLYALALLFFWATAYFVPIRSYYFIAIIIIFEIIFLAFRNKWKSIFASIIRLIPFLYIFYQFFIYGGDSRTGQIKGLVDSLLSGKFYIFYGFLSSIGNIIVPDNFTSKLFIWQLQVTKITSIGFPYIILGTLFLSFTSFYLLLRKTKKGKFLTILFSIFTLIWAIVEYSIFNIPIINLNETSSYTILIGGIIILILLGIYFTIDKKNKNKYLFLLASFLISVAAYWAYEPLVVLNTTHRYFVGAFSILVGILGIIYTAGNKKVKILIIIWGVFNLVNGIAHENLILNNRTLPVDSFYKELSKNLPNIQKGDILYFDLADNIASDHFNSAISTASMPNETSIAWRYGIDRYDFSVITNYNTLISTIKTKSIPLTNIHTFYYSDTSLIDTTKTTTELLQNGTQWKKLDFTTNDSKDLIINLKKTIPSVTPIEFEIILSASPPNLSTFTFPYIKDSSLSSNTVAINKEKRTLAFKYKQSKINIIKNSKITTSSSWQKDLPNNLIDSNIETNWRSDRILWGQEKTYLILDIGENYLINKFAWINGYGNSTPTKYSLETSTDKKNWTKITSVSLNKRIDTKDPQTISFAPTKIRFIKMNFDETLDQDATQVAEIWPILSEFDSLDITDTEKFLTNPFGYVPDIQSFNETLSSLNNQGKIKLVNGTSNKLLYDNLTHAVSFSMMPGGTEISKLVLSNLEIPGKLTVKNINYKYLNLKEMQEK